MLPDSPEFYGRYYEKHFGLFFPGHCVKFIPGTSVKHGKFGAAMKTTYGVNSGVRRTLSACNQNM